MALPSGATPQIGAVLSSNSPISVLPAPPTGFSIPPQKPNPGQIVVGSITSSPASRNAGSGDTLITVSTTIGGGSSSSTSTSSPSTPVIGQTIDDQNSDNVASDFTQSFNQDEQTNASGLTPAQQAQALQVSASSVLGSVEATLGVGSSGSPSVASCLASLLGSMNLSISAQSSLCSLVQAGQLAAKNAADQASGAVLNAAIAATNGAAAMAPLTAIQSALAAIPAAQLAACPGAAQLSAMVNGALKTATNAVAAASSGATDTLVNALTSAQTLAASLAMPPPFCSKGS